MDQNIALVGSFLVVALAEGGKWLTAKLGKEVSTKIIYSLVFVLTLIYVVLQQRGFFELETVRNSIQIFLTAVGTYEVVIKKFLQPTLGLGKNK